MNQKQILVLLKNDPTDADVRVAIDWLKNQKPTSKSAQDVLRELLGKPQFEAELDWLAAWLKSGSWDGLFPTISWVPSLALYDWLIQLVQNNPCHPQAADVWRTLVFEYGDVDVTDKAAQWFERYGGADKNNVALAAQILDEGTTDTIVEKAISCLEDSPSDSILITSLIDNVGDQSAIDRGLSLLREENDPRICSYVAAALLRKDSIKYTPAIREYLQKHWQHRFPYAVIFEIFTEADNQHSDRLVIEWMQGHDDASLQILCHALRKTPSQQMADYAWSWFEDNWKTEGRPLLSVLNELLTCDNIELPPAAISFAQTWLQSNKPDQQWIDVACSLLQALPLQERATLGHKLLEKVADLDRGCLLVTMVRCVSDLESTKLAQEWRKRFPAHKYADEMTLALMKYDPSNESIVHARGCVVSINRQMDWLILASLVRAGDQVSIVKAKEWLRERYINRRYSSDHADRGNVLMALLGSDHCDEDILDRTKEWLRSRPLRFQRERYNEVRHAYEDARRNFKNNDRRE